MKRFTNFKVFNKVVRKYWKRYAKRSSFLYKGRKITEWWVADNIWCCYVVEDQNELKNQKIRNWFQFDVEPEGIDSFLNDSIKYYGKKVMIQGTETIGKFVGFVLVNNGVYYGIRHLGESLITFYPMYCKLILWKE